MPWVVNFSIWNHVRENYTLYLKDLHTHYPNYWTISPDGENTKMSLLLKQKCSQPDFHMKMQNLIWIKNRFSKNQFSFQNFAIRIKLCTLIGKSGEIFSLIKVAF